MTDLVLGMHHRNMGISSRTISIDGSLAPPNEGEEDVTERRKVEKYTQGRSSFHIRFLSCFYIRCTATIV
ncbi:hypothetical protein PsorP6_008685 [Peronosclerospora sorghi]|uniref:Uncharacterized protein n=1 Tax=Peronosclerospora sorghi TaxID=230839 RepID=A0ACC0W0U7_9STRA|nr:hypothetical protein PsorP6_008685 [Peronosclerospora sorghi]